MLTPDRHTLLDQSLGQVTLMPWLRASAEERKKALHPYQALVVVERGRRRGRGLGEVHALLSLHQGASRGLSDDRLAEEILDAVKARQLIALPGWVAPRTEPVAPILPELPLPPPPPARVRKEATGDEVEPTIRLVNLESRHFVPGKETVRISYAIDGPVEKVEKVRMKVKSLGMTPEGQLVEVRMLPGPFQASGDLLWNGGAAMGIGYITLRGSPYEVNFELTSMSGSVSTSDPAIVALRVSSLSIGVDASGSLPVAAGHQSAIETLVSDLKKNGVPWDCSGRVMIDSPVFQTDFDETTGPASASEYAKMAGEGVSIPLKVDVRLTSKTGEEMRSPPAVVGTRVLWDFSYLSADELSVSLGARNVVEPQRGFLMGVLTDREDVSLPKGTGALLPLGGRRETGRSAGSGRPTIWEASPDWPLERPSVRTWAAFTRCGGGQHSTEDGAVYFRSGRIAGDTHQIRATLDLDEVLDTNGDDAPVTPHLRSNSITITNWRRVPIVGDWFVGETAEFDYAAVRAAFRPAAMMVERVPGLIRSDMTDHWTREYAGLAMRARAEAWPFLADALDPDPQDQAIRFRPLEEFHQAPEARTYRESVRRRARNFLLARDEVEYRRECQKHCWKVLRELVSTLKLPSDGVTMVKFGADRLHNKQDQSTEIGGLSIPVGRHSGLVLQFTHRSNWKVTVHELGHSLFLAHAPGRIEATRDPDDVERNGHAADSTCMMSYAGSPVFCALCLLKLAGCKYLKISRHGQVHRGE
jgi:hypothetical protein